MKTAILIGIIVGLFGCDGAPEDPCYIPPTSNTAYQDCKSTSDGMEAVIGCGELPQDGTEGHLIPVGCTVQIGTSKPETGICLSVCP